MPTDMHYGATALIFQKADMLRNNPTVSEAKLWKHVNKSQLGLKFRRQHPIATFIADFYCHKAKLIIEIDGKNHNAKGTKIYDDGRTYDLEQLGVSVLRFSNEQVLNEIEYVIEQIKNKVKHKLSSAHTLNP